MGVERTVSPLFSTQTLKTHAFSLTIHLANGSGLTVRSTIPVCRSRYRVWPNTSSMANWLPKNASSSSAIAVSVQCTAFAPRQP